MPAMFGSIQDIDRTSVGAVVAVAIGLAFAETQAVRVSLHFAAAIVISRFIHCSRRVGAILCWAARHDYTVILQTCLRIFGIYMNSATGDYGTPLQCAAAAGRSGSVAVLLRSRANLEESAAGGHTALTMAIAQGHTSAAMLLLDARADANASGSGSLTPLHVAVLRADVASTELLLARDAQIEANDSRGRTPLMAAASSDKRWVAASALLNCRADVNTISRGDGKSPLLEVANWKSGDAACAARALIGHQADPSLADSFGSTALHVACRHGNADLVTALCAAGALPTAQDNDGATAFGVLMEACAREPASEDLCRSVDVMLAAAPSAATQLDFGDMSPVHLLCMFAAMAKTAPTKALSILIAHRADPSIEEERGWTAVHFAATAEVAGKELMAILEASPVPPRTFWSSLDLTKPRGTSNQKYLTRRAECRRAKMDESSCEPKLLAKMPEASRGIDLAAIIQQLEVRDVSVNQGMDLNDYSIFGAIALERKAAIVDHCRTDPYLDRAMGCMVGMGIGDGMGHMFEFLPCRDTPGVQYFDLSTMRFHSEYNRFALRYGQWTDDAAMGLCLADSLILRRGYDGRDVRERFWNWWNRGYNNAFRLDEARPSRDSVGLGGNIATSLQAMDKLSTGQRPDAIYIASGDDSGNGSLMRLAPVPLFFHAVPPRELHRLARQSSRSTHPGIVAAEACALLAHLVVFALRRSVGTPVNAKAFLEDATAKFLELSGLEAKSHTDKRYLHLLWLVKGCPERPTESCWAWREPTLGLEEALRARGAFYNGYPVSSEYFGSYALDGLAVAMWSVYHTSSFDEAVAKCINVCGDADSNGSICGQIAGAFYGLSAVNTKFQEWLNRWDQHEFAVRAVLLHEFGASLSDQTCEAHGASAQTVAPCSGLGEGGHLTSAD
mmetsp:Transcript_39314/g.108449  ORF Transcript_39314/g.108449 Transcript_39314/m.108449 type:complete len:902 (-) Transcript_39314:72-2777(-)